MKNIITLPEVENALGVTFPARDRKQIVAQTPKKVPEGWLAVPVLPISLKKLWELTEKKDKRVFWNTDWYANKPWFTEVMEPRWIMVQTEAREETKNMTYEAQKKCLRQGEEIATAQEGIYAMALNFLVHGERLFTNYYVRTSTKTSGGHLVNFGNFKADGANVNRWKPVLAASYLGSLFSRSLESLENLKSEPLELDPPETVQVSVTINGRKYEGMAQLVDL